MKQVSRVAVAGPLCPGEFLTNAFAWRRNIGHALIEEPDPMLIDESLLRGVAFLFPTREDAEKRTKFGGTGFVVGKQVRGAEGDRGGAYVPYLVSNRHVVYNSGASVASINRRDKNPPAIFEFEPTDWTVHPNGADVAAICLWPYLDGAIHEISFIQDFGLLTKEAIQHFEVGVGDEVFMIGRFLNHQGKSVNRPAARFGCISMMPEPLFNKALNREELSFAVELRSRTGFSGSPVALYRTPATILTDLPANKMELYGLLGVNWGYIYDEEDEDGNRENSWLNGVVPAWKILETLDVPSLQERHEEIEEEFHKDREANSPVEPSFAAAGPVRRKESTGGSHKARFDGLLEKALKLKSTS